jgi:hypothetical protein
MTRFIPPTFAEQKQGPTKVVFGIPIPKSQRPHARTVESLENCLPLVEAAGFEHGMTYSTGNPYISGARAELTRKALDAKADIVVYLDYDVSWDPQDMVKLLTTEGDVVGGTYRCKVEDESKYMGAIYTHAEGPNEGRALTRPDGCIKARALPAGFLKVTTLALDKFMRAYPEFCYGPQYSLSVDLFHHGAHEGIWWGEDYAFCRNYEAKCGEIWLIPDMNIDHHGFDGSVYKGNYHEFLLRQPGGSKYERIPENDGEEVRQQHGMAAAGA